MHRNWLDREIERLGVSEEISPDDEMLVDESVPGAKEHYFLVGRSALRCVGVAMLAAGKTGAGRILDLPCGHGRVMRWLRAAFPEAEITGCDLLTGGVDYCAKTFDAFPVHSRPRPRDIQLRGSFDLIWCGSLLTHLDAPVWDDFLRFFSSLLAPSGLLVFSTHGRRAAAKVRDGNYYGLGQSVAQNLLSTFEATGFGFAGYGDRHEHEARSRSLLRRFSAKPSRDPEDYGISFSSPQWVCERLSRHPELRLVCFNERAWDDHQDIVGCVLPPDRERMATA